MDTAAKRLRRPAKASLWYMAANILLKGAAFLMTPLFTRALSSEEYGLYALFVSWEAFLTAAATPQASGSVLLRGMQKFAGERDRFLLTAERSMLATTGAAFLLFLLLRERIAEASGLSLPIWIALFLSTAANTAIRLGTAREKYGYRPGYPAFVALASGVAAPLIALLLIARTPLRAEARIFAATGVLLPIALIFFYKSEKKAARERLAPLPEARRFLWRRGLPLLIGDAAYFVLSGADSILIGRLCGAAEVGKYAIARSSAMALVAVGGGLISAMGPWMLRKLAAGEKERVRAAIGEGVRLGIPILLLFLCAVPEIFGFLAPSGYEGAIDAVYPLTAAVLPLLFCRLLTQAGTCYDRPVLLSLPIAGAATFALASNLLLLGRLGPAWAAATALLAYSLAAGGLIFALGKAAGGRLISLREGAQALIGCCGGAMLLRLMQGWFIGRLFCAGALCALILLRAKKIAALVREPRAAEKAG